MMASTILTHLKENRNANTVPASFPFHAQYPKPEQQKPMLSESTILEQLLEESPKFCPLRLGTDLYKDLPERFYKRNNNKDDPWTPVNFAYKPPSFYSSFGVAKDEEIHVGSVDFVADAESMKELLKIPSTKHSASLILHRVGNSVLMDHFEIPFLYEKENKSTPLHKYSSENGSWEWFNEFVELTVGQKTISDILWEDRQLVQLVNKKNLNKVFHLGLVGEMKFKTAASSNSKKPKNIAPGPSHALLGSDGRFLQKVLWKFSNHSMLVGSQVPVFNVQKAVGEGNDVPINELVTLQSIDGLKSPTISTDFGIDMWMDNLMLDVRETLLCHQKNHFVTCNEFIPTDALPKRSGFDPNVVQEQGATLLTLIKQCTSKTGHSYWLYRAPESESFKIYDLTRINEEIKSMERNPWTPAIGCLLYNICQAASDEMMSNTVISMMRHFLTIYPENEYPLYAAGAIYHVLNSRIPDSMNLTNDGSINLITGLTKPRISFDYEWPRNGRMGYDGEKREYELGDIFNLQYYHELCHDYYFEKLMTAERQFDGKVWAEIQKSDEKEKANRKRDVDRGIATFDLDLADFISVNFFPLQLFPSSEISNLLDQAPEYEKARTSPEIPANVSTFTMENDKISIDQLSDSDQSLEKVLKKLYQQFLEQAELTKMPTTRLQTILSNLEENKDKNSEPTRKLKKKRTDTELDIAVAQIENSKELVPPKAEILQMPGTSCYKQSLPASPRTRFLHGLLVRGDVNYKIPEPEKKSKKKRNQQERELDHFKKPGKLQEIPKNVDCYTNGFGNKSSRRFDRDDPRGFEEAPTPLSWVFVMTAKLLIRQLLTGIIILETVKEDLTWKSSKSKAETAKLNEKQDVYKTLCQLMHNKMALLMYSLAKHALQQLPRQILLAKFCAKQALFHNAEGSLQRSDIAAFSWYFAGVAQSYLIPCNKGQDQLLENYLTLDGLIQHQEPHMHLLCKKFKLMNGGRDADQAHVSKEILVQSMPIASASMNKISSSILTPVATMISYFNEACKESSVQLREFFYREIAYRTGNTGYYCFLIMKKVAATRHIQDTKLFQMVDPGNSGLHDEILKIMELLQLAATKWRHADDEGHMNLMRHYYDEIQIFEYFQGSDPKEYSLRQQFRRQQGQLGPDDDSRNFDFLKIGSSILKLQDPAKVFNLYFPENGNKAKVE